MLNFICDEGNVLHTSQEAHYFFYSFPIPYSEIRKYNTLEQNRTLYLLFIHYKLYVDSYKHFLSNKLADTCVSTHETEISIYIFIFYLFIYMCGCFASMYVCAWYPQIHKKTMNPLGLEFHFHTLKLGLVIRSMSSGRTANFLILQPPVLYFNL